MRLERTWLLLARSFVWLYLALVPPVVGAVTPPPFQGDVLDETGTLDSSQQEAIRQRIAELRSKDGVWAAVFITRNLQGQTIEEVAVSTFESWQLGKRGKDNGLLVIVAPSERKMRIEVGYGLEGTITDVLSKHIVDGIYKPLFREGKYTEGLLSGFDAISMAMRGEPVPAGLTTPPLDAAPETQIDGGLLLQTLLLVWIGNLCVPVLYWLARRGRPRYASEHADKVRTAFILFAFIGFVFGLFISVFSIVFPDDPAIIMSLSGANALFGIVFFLPLLLSARTKGGVSAHDDASDERSRWRSSSDSSSWDSASSDSSSSGGGSSGGGGASGNY